MKTKNYRYIYLPSGDYLQIKFDEEGIVYDRFNKDDEHQESYGYDFYNYPKEIVKSFVYFLGVNGFEKEIDKIEELSKDHEVLYKRIDIIN
jgi:hypothetical protein